MNRDDSKKPDHSNQSWARFVERRRLPEYQGKDSLAGSQNPTDADKETRDDSLIDHVDSTKKQTPVNKVALNDLAMDSMMNMLPRIDHGADAFTNKVLAKLNLQHPSEKQKAEEPQNGKPVLKELTAKPKKINGNHNSFSLVEPESVATVASEDAPTPADFSDQPKKSTRLLIAIAVAISLFGIGLTIGFIVHFNASRTDQPISEKHSPAANEVDDKIDSDRENGAMDDSGKNKKPQDNLVHHPENNTQENPGKNPADIRNKRIIVKLPKNDLMPRNRGKQPDSVKPNRVAKKPVQPRRAKFARMVDTSRALWSGQGSNNLRQRLALKSGDVKIETPRGVKVQIHGPAIFKFTDAEKVELLQGKLIANVGQLGNGFAVKTPGSQVVDLGTDFEVDVSAAGDSRVYVKDGKVEVELDRQKKTGKWRQYAEQTSVISKAGKKSDWVLSFRFDKNGFAHIEFNGEVLDQFVTHDTAPFVLQKIAAAVGPKLKAVQPYLKNSIRGAICIDSEFVTFDKPEQLDSACKHAVKSINSRRFEQLEIDKFIRARRDFERQFNVTLRKIKRQANVRNQMPMISINLDATGVKGSIRFPSTQSTKTLGTSSEAQAIQSVAKSTETLLNHLAKEQIRNTNQRNQKLVRPADPRKRAENRRPNVLDLFQQVTDVPDFGEIVLNKPVKPDLKKFQMKSRIQKLDEEQLRMALYNHVGEVRGFTDKQIKDAILNYAQANNKSLAQGRGRGVRIDRRGVRIGGAEDANQEPVDEPLKKILPRRSDLHGMPFVMGDECRLDDEDTQALSTISSELGTAISRFNFFGSLPSFAVSTNGSGRTTVTGSGQNNFRHQLISRTIRSVNDKVTNEEKSVSGLVQMLQADQPVIRYELLKNLDRIKTNQAIEAMANRAIYDLSPEVRAAAIQFLEEYSKETSRKVFIKAFSYPWAPVAQHSAEALVRLKDTDAVSELVELLDKPDPSLPFKNPKGATAVREVVAINHMKNCLLCHAPSTDASDSLRGLMPTPGQPLPRQYYKSQSGGFVRADVTYLTQDFSVTQPVPNAKHWPKMQRFDYVVRQRTLSPAESNQWEKTKRAKLARHQNMHRKAILFALRELTGKFPENNDIDTWRRIVAVMKLKEKGIGDKF